LGRKPWGTACKAALGSEFAWAKTTAEVNTSRGKRVNLTYVEIFSAPPRRNFISCQASSWA
jgi:hypothetical protein